MTRATPGRLLGIGLVFAVLGIVFVFNPGMAANHSVSSVFLFVIGLIGAIFTGTELASVYRTRRQQALTPDKSPLPDAGQDLDRTFGIISKESFRNTVEERKAVRERLARIAVRVLIREYSCSRLEAQEYLADGSWTADSEAAAFFATDLIDPDDFYENLKASFVDESQFQRRARRAVSELLAMEGFDE